ncbi:hypothetical protein JMN32_05430 [Fulvivirga sp. 29W222]|uniref:Uncharacterized protein n=1 Tax=Fulvivirga marina TaxID=2494733 RepID=A0A937FWM1_9BACT|nr:hypothetical protein [Fulvivirga marina]MBL6445740.1 hypothetical protein [Fulvivirga marina]
MLDSYKQHPFISTWNTETFHFLSTMCMVRTIRKNGQMLIDQKSFESLLTTFQNA